jgi:hypothetical protein
VAGCGNSELRVAVSANGWLFVPLDEKGTYGDGGATDIYALSPDGSVVQPVTATPEVKESWLQASPDGRQVVYVSATPQTENAPQTAPYELRLTELDGSLTRTLVESTQLIASPSFAPSGDYIAYAVMSQSDASKYSIYLYDVQTQQSTELVSEITLLGMGSELTWLPTGEALVLIDYRVSQDELGIETARGEIVHLSLDGKKEVLLSGMIQTKGANQGTVTASDGLVPFAFASASPDGRTIAFTAAEYEKAQGAEKGRLLGGVYLLYLKDRSVGRIHVVPLSETIDNISLFPTFSPAGGYLAFTTISYGSVPTAIWKSIWHPEQAPTGSLYVFDLAEEKTMKKVSGIDPWIPPFWGDESRVGYATMSGLGGTALGGSESLGSKLGTLEPPEHSENRFLWLEEMHSGHRVNLSERLRMMILQEDLNRRVLQLETDAVKRLAEQRALQEKIDVQLAELRQKTQQIEEADKSIADLRTQLDTKAQEMETLKSELQSTKSQADNAMGSANEMGKKLVAEIGHRQSQYASVFLVALVLVALVGFWTWLRTRGT